MLSEKARIHAPKSRFKHPTLNTVLGFQCLNIQIATKVIGMYVMLNTILVIVTIRVLTPNALARGAATGVRDV